MAKTAHADVLPLERACSANCHALAGDFFHIAFHNVCASFHNPHDSLQHICDLVGRVNE